MAILTARVAVRTGALKTLAAASAGGDQFLNTGREILEINNASGGAITVTMAPAGLPGGLALSSHATSVAAGSTQIIGPFDPGYYNSVAGLVSVSYSGVTSLTVCVISVP